MNAQTANRSQKMTLKQATEAGIIGSRLHQVVVPSISRAIRHAGRPNCKGMMKAETVPDVLDGRQSRVITLGASTMVLVTDLTPPPVSLDSAIDMGEGQNASIEPDDFLA